MNKNINIKSKGKSECLEFISSSNKIGELVYNDKGFSFNKQVFQDKIKSLTYSGDLIVDASEGNIFELTLTGNCNISFINLSAGSYLLIVKQDSTGGRSLTFPNSGYYVESDNGTPSLDESSANQIDFINLLCDGENVYITASYNFVEIATL